MLAVSEEKIEMGNIVIYDTEQGFSSICDGIGAIVKDTLYSLTSEGSLSIEESQQLAEEYSEQNVLVLKNFNNIKKKQMKRLNKYMAEKKEQKVSQLKEKHELEKREVCTYCSRLMCVHIIML